MAYTDITGQRFGRLVALRRDPPGLGAKWHCRCDCGKLTAVSGHKLMSGRTKSCGCYRAERNRLGPVTHGRSRLGLRLYEIWMGMRSRCNTESSHNYSNYGGRGIRLCEEWNDFAAFEGWSRSHGYKDHLSIDRINSDGNYEPSNCRWVGRAVQNRNKRSNVMAVVNGKTACIKDHADEAGVSYWTLIKCVGRGEPAEDAISRLKARSN